MFKLLCRTVSASWNYLVFSMRKTNYINRDYFYQRKGITNRPIDPGHEVNPVKEIIPRYSINTFSGKTYWYFNDNKSVTDNILNQLFIHLIPKGPYIIHEQVVIHKERQNQCVVGIYTFKLDITYEINNPIEFVRHFYHYIGTDARNASPKGRENLYNSDYFKRALGELITPLLQQSCNKLINNNSDPNNMSGVDLVQLWKKFTSDKKRRIDMHNFSLIQINNEYKKIPNYIILSKCVVSNVEYEEI